MPATVPHVNGISASGDLASKFIGIISTRRTEVTDTLTRKRRELRDLPREVGDQGDKAADSECRHTMHTDLARLAREQQRLDAAYVRITNGTYGFCADPSCREEIDARRLDVDPCAVLCRDCAVERDTTGSPKLPPGCRPRRS